MGQRAVSHCTSQSVSEALSTQPAGGWTHKLLQIGLSLHYSLAVTIIVSTACRSLIGRQECRVSELMTRYLWGDGGDIQSASAQFVKLGIRAAGINDWLCV